ncbi:MAG TPA: TIGR03067 domain-containing protein [Gemmataceae bacterium]|nr:TIGR03067 domain-containing protein [Gemmataceae bacterium]
MISHPGHGIRRHPPTCWTYKRDKASWEKGQGEGKGQEDPSAKELKALEGDWKVVGLEEGGRKASEDDVKAMRWTFRGSEMQGMNPGEKAGDKCKVKIDPSKGPKHIDLTTLEGELKGKTLEGIYKLEDDRLTICLRDEKAPEKGRPTEFTAEKGSSQGVITLERVKK